MKKALGLIVTIGWVVGCCMLAHADAMTAGGQNSQATQQKQGKAGQQSAEEAAAAQAAQAEFQAFQLIQNELDPDKTIQLVNDFEKKFPKSRGLHFAFLRAADSYRQKGDMAHVVEYGEKSVKLNADNPAALLLVASILPQPSMLQGSDLDKEKKLTEAEEYANRALKALDQIPKQPNYTDEQWQKIKASFSSMAHSSLGMVHLQRSSMSLNGSDPEELGKAEKEYKAAVSMAENPDPADYFRLGEIYTRTNKVDDAIEAFSKAAALDQSGAIKPLAEQKVEELKKKKSEAKPPAKP